MIVVVTKAVLPLLLLLLLLLAAAAALACKESITSKMGAANIVAGESNNMVVFPNKSLFSKVSLVRNALYFIVLVRLTALYRRPWCTLYLLYLLCYDFGVDLRKGVMEKGQLTAVYQLHHGYDVCVRAAHRMRRVP